MYERLNVKKQVCGVNTRGGASTQDPDYPEDHPKRKEQEARKKKFSAGKSPNENPDNDDSEEQNNDTSISDAETEDNNNEEEESPFHQPLHLLQRFLHRLHDEGGVVHPLDLGFVVVT